MQKKGFWKRSEAPCASMWDGFSAEKKPYSSSSFDFPTLFDGCMAADRLLSSYLKRRFNPIER
jgi:hypothetical protein